MLDPLVASIVSIGFGLMFLLASVHKLTGFERFRTILGDYRIMPGILVPLVATAVPALEVALGLAWLFGSEPRVAGLMTAGLLVLYTSAIALNLLRGRVHLSCGCGFGKAARGDEALSWWLVVRNAALLMAAVAATLPQSERSIGVLDYGLLVAALLGVVLLFSAANQLMRNASAINSWRRGVARHD